MKRALLSSGPRGRPGACPSTASARVVELGAGSTPAGHVELPRQSLPGRLPGDRLPGPLGEPQEPVPRSGATATWWRSPSRCPSSRRTRSTRSTRASAGRRRCASPRSRRGDTRKTRLNHRLLRQSDGLRGGELPGLEPDLRAQASRSGSRRATSWPSPSPPGCRRWPPISPGGNWWRSSRLKGKCGSDDALAPPSTQEDAARDHPLRLHLQGRPASLHRHVHPGSASDQTPAEEAQASARRAFPGPRGRASIGS